MCLSHQYFVVFLVSGRAMSAISDAMSQLSRECSPDRAKRNPGLAPRASLPGFRGAFQFVAAFEACHFCRDVTQTFAT